MEIADNSITIRIVIVVFLSSSSLKANNLTIEEIFIFTNNIENKILKNNAMHFKITIFFFVLIRLMLQSYKFILYFATSN